MEKQPSNRAENQIRPFTVGRKNRLFSDTPAGAKHHDFLPGNFCILCRILQVRVPLASLETVQKQCRNRALTLGQMKNNDF